MGGAILLPKNEQRDAGLLQFDGEIGPIGLMTTPHASLTPARANSLFWSASSVKPPGNGQRSPAGAARFRLPWTVLRAIPSITAISRALLPPASRSICLNCLMVSLPSLPASSSPRSPRGADAKLLTQGRFVAAPPGRLLTGILADFRSERWPIIDRNARRLHSGIRTAYLRSSLPTVPHGSFEVSTNAAARCEIANARVVLKEPLEVGTRKVTGIVLIHLCRTIDVRLTKPVSGIRQGTTVIPADRLASMRISPSSSMHAIGTPIAEMRSKEPNIIGRS